jgi:cytochrome c oxidase subunit 2
MMFWPVQAMADYLPVKGSSIAGEVDAVYNFTLVCSIVSFIILMGGMAYFIIKYRRRSDNDKTAYISHDHRLEALWSVIPFILFMVIFAWGYYVYNKMRTFPDDALNVAITGKKWAWTMAYADGTTLVNELVVPVGKPIILNMTSEDVIHSFFIPSFRVKQDVVPGKMSKMTFTPIQTGEFHIFCAEYCGTQHSKMMGTVKVLEQKEFETWQKEQQDVGTLTPAQKGEKLYKTQACFTCHSIDGTKIVGPTFKGLFGKTESVGGKPVLADEAYIRESILNPLAKIVDGYAPAMPAFQGRLTEEEIGQLTEYIKTLK